MMYSNKDCGSLVDHWAELQPERLALVDGASRWTYGDLRKGIRNCREFLSGQGVGKGDAVVTVLRNGAEFLAVFFAALQTGCSVVPCDTAVDASLLRARAQVCQAGLAIVGSEAEVDLAVRAGLRCPVAVADFASDGFADIAKPGIGGDSRAEGGAMPDDAFLVAFTSGSTAAPKGACLKAESLFMCAENLARRLGLTSQDVVLVPLPWSHMFGLVAGMLATLLAGAVIVSMRKHDPKEAIRLIESEGVTVHHGVPTMFFKELSALKAWEGPVDLSSLRTGIAAGSFVSCMLVERAEREMGMRMASAYGSTEVVSVSMNRPSDPLKVRQETSGRVFEGVEVRVVDIDGTPLPTGSIGELCVRGPGVMTGYLKAPEETAKVMSPDGWFSTGDLVSIDEEGFLRVLGRKKDLIIRGGNNVAPSALECLYLGHPDIEDVVVMGYPDEVFGEKIVCFVVPRQGSVLEAEEVRAYARGRVPKFSRPDDVVFKARLPRLPSGKTDKRLLKREFMKERGLEQDD